MCLHTAHLLFLPGAIAALSIYSSSFCFAAQFSGISTNFKQWVISLHVVLRCNHTITPCFHLFRCLFSSSLYQVEGIHLGYHNGLLPNNPCWVCIPGTWPKCEFSQFIEFLCYKRWFHGHRYFLCVSQVPRVNTQNIGHLIKIKYFK